MIGNITKLALIFIPLIFSDSSLANESGDILREKSASGILMKRPSTQE
jgi:hypothetical protein